MQNKRKIFLINPAFQLKYSFYVVSWIFALSLLYPVVISNIFDFFLSVSKGAQPPDTIGVLQQMRSEILFLVVFFHIFFILTVFLLSLFVSHRIAGPMFKLQGYIEKARKGDIKKSLRFRDADHFQGLADSYNELMEEMEGLVQVNVKNVRTAIKKIESALDFTSDKGKADLKKALTELQASTRSS